MAVLRAFMSMLPQLWCLVLFFYQDVLLQMGTTVTVYTCSSVNHFIHSPPPLSVPTPSLCLPTLSLPSQTPMFLNSCSSTALPVVPLTPHPSFRQSHQTSSHLSPPLWTPPCLLDISPHPSRGPTSPHSRRSLFWTPPLYRTTVRCLSLHL